MSTQRFGSLHTERKLQLVESYLQAYATALKNQNFNKIYIDAFAGTGEYTPADNMGGNLRLDLADAEQIHLGSARRALQVTPPFDRYILIEKSRRKAILLNKIAQNHKEYRIDIIVDDANSAICDLCQTIRWTNTRAVVFLDPFGLQVKWATIEALANTKAVDLWFLVPDGIGMNRQVTVEGQILLDGGKRIDEMLGGVDGFATN